MIPYFAYQRKRFLIFVWKSFIFPILWQEKRGLGPKQTESVEKMRTTDMADELFSRPGAAAPGCGWPQPGAAGSRSPGWRSRGRGWQAPAGGMLRWKCPASACWTSGTPPSSRPCAELRALLPPEGPVLVLGVGNRRVTAGPGPRTAQNPLSPWGGRSPAGAGLPPGGRRCAGGGSHRADPAAAGGGHGGRSCARGPGLRGQPLLCRGGAAGPHRAVFSDTGLYPAEADTPRIWTRQPWACR